MYIFSELNNINITLDGINEYSKSILINSIETKEELENLLPKMIYYVYFASKRSLQRYFANENNSDSTNNTILCQIWNVINK